MPEPAFDAPDSSPPLPPVTGSTGKSDSLVRSLDDMTGGSDAQYDAITKADLSLTKQKIGAEAGMEAQRKRSDDAYAQRQERLIAAEGATMDDIKPWNADKELNDRKTNLWEQFGSPGFVIAMLASSFSGTPMNSALNAGAAAMNAINEGDMDKYHKAFDAWKENSNLTLKRLELEEHEFGQIDNLRSKNMESWRAAATALASRFNDKRMLALLEGGYDQQALEARDALNKSKIDLAQSRDFLMQNDVRMKIINTDPDYKSGDPKKMAAAIHRADDAMRGDDAKMTPDQRFQLLWHQQNPEGSYTEFSEAYDKFKAGQFMGRGGTGMQREIEQRKQTWDAAHPEAQDAERDEAHDKITREVATSYKPQQLPPAQRDKIQSQIDGYDNNIALIDDLKERIKKYHFSVGILSGIPLAGEKLADVLAGSSAADRAQIKSDIEKLKLGASRLLLDTQGRPLAANEHRIDTIIRGGSYGDTTANTLKSLESLEGDYANMRDQHKKRLTAGGAAETPAGAAPEPKDNKSWDAFPTVGIKGTD